MSIALEGYRIERIQMREEEYLFYSDAEKDAENEAQKLHDKFVKKIDEIYAAKEKEIMTV